MSFNCCSGNFSSHSFGGYLQDPRSSCDSSYPNKVFYSTELQTPITHQLDSPLYSGCQETCSAPTSCPTSYVVSRPCRPSCYRPTFSTCYSPSQTFSGFASKGFQSWGCGSPFLGFGSSGFQSTGCGPRTFSRLNCRSNFYRPTFFSSKSCQSVSYQPSWGCGFC